MISGIVNTGIPLQFSSEFVSEVEAVVDMNANSNTAKVALFLSRLIKGLQNLSRSEAGFAVSWGCYSYEIEDIGIVSFRPLLDAESGQKVFHILSIYWTFATSRFFREFLV